MRRAAAACLAIAAAPAIAADAPVGAHAQPPVSRHSIYKAGRFAGRADTYYTLVWGIDSLRVSLVESGELVRFSYRILDPAKARLLNDKQARASLVDQAAGVSLVVPTMENIGQLRQTETPKAGRAYWVAFSNKGRPVKKGDRVDVVIGPFTAANLAVD